MLCESNRLVYPISRMAMRGRRQRRSTFISTPWQLQNQFMNVLQTQRQLMQVCWARRSTLVISVHCRDSQTKSHRLERLLASNLQQMIADAEGSPVDDFSFDYLYSA